MISMLGIAAIVLWVLIRTCPFVCLDFGAVLVNLNNHLLELGRSLPASFVTESQALRWEATGAGAAGGRQVESRERAANRRAYPKNYKINSVAMVFLLPDEDGDDEELPGL